MSGPFVSTLLELLDSQVGVTEKHGNEGIPFERYALKGEVPAAWCARFVRWAFSECGRPLPGNIWRLGAVQYMREQCELAGWMVKDPQPGDIVFFKTRKGSDAGAGHHVGIVSAVADGHIQTIEGNAGGGIKVARNRYALSSPSLWGFARAPEPSA